MKVIVTHLKAPWPAGTVPGHVVDLVGCDAIPAWALGKCVPAAEDAQAVSEWRRVVVPVELPAAAPAPAGDLVVNPEPKAKPSKAKS